jgi:hypothetical protein
MTSIYIKNSSSIIVYDNADIIYKMNRKETIPFLKIVGEIFQHDKKVAIVDLFFTQKKIVFQDFKFNIKILKQYLYSSIFCVDNSVIKIKQNPFFFLNKKFGTVYYNSELIIEITIKSLTEVSGYTLELKFFTENELVKQACLICFMIDITGNNLS